MERELQQWVDTINITVPELVEQLEKVRKQALTLLPQDIHNDDYLTHIALSKAVGGIIEIDKSIGTAIDNLLLLITATERIDKFQRIKNENEGETK